MVPSKVAPTSRSARSNVESELSMQSESPLLTIAIPTFNRCEFLSELLECILPQLLSASGVELLISDNCSTDETAATVERFRARGLDPRYIRNPVNIGADANFLQCFRESAGKYLWIMGDDDVLVDGSIGRILRILQHSSVSEDDSGDFDMAYVSSFGFSGKFDPGRISIPRDPFGRFAEVVTDGRYFLDRVHANIVLLSVVIVNKKRLTSSGMPPIRDLGDCNLQQLAWVLPSVRRRGRILYIWERLVGYRRSNTSGFGVCQVFGIQLPEIASQYYSNDRDMYNTLINALVRQWFPDVIAQLRRGEQPLLIAEDYARILTPTHSGNWRYWIFLYPVASLSLPLAFVLFRLTRALNSVWRALQVLMHYYFRRGDSFDGLG